MIDVIRGLGEELDLPVCFMSCHTNFTTDDKRLKELCNIAEDNGVTIALETEPNQLLHNMALFYEYADKINCPGPVRSPFKSLSDHEGYGI